MYQTEALPHEFRASIWGIKKRHFADEHIQLGGAGITVVDLA